MDRATSIAIKVVFTILLIAAVVDDALAQRFGWDTVFDRRMKVTLQRKSPPQVYLMGDTISVQIKSTTGGGSVYVPQLANMIETELINKERRLKPEHNRPDTVISCTITRLESSDKFEPRTSKEQQKTGTRQEWNSKKQAYENKDVYSQVDVTRNYKIVSGALTASYQVKLTKTGTVLDAANFSPSYSNAFLDGNGAPDRREVEQGLLRSLVDSLVSRLVPTIEPVRDVLLAKGKLEEAGKFGQQGLWPKMQEMLEKMEPLKKPKDDAYRMYDIGVTYEAMAYAAEDLQTTTKLLDKASDYYSKALEMNVDEKYFKQPQGRITQAILQYAKLKEQLASYESAKGPQPETGGGSKSPGPIADPPRPIPQNDTLTNQRVIEWVKKGSDDANVISQIKSARSVTFDLSPRAYDELLDNKVSSAVITAMRAKQASQRVRPPRRPLKRKGAKP